MTTHTAAQAMAQDKHELGQDALALKDLFESALRDAEEQLRLAQKEAERALNPQGKYSYERDIDAAKATGKCASHISRLKGSVKMLCDTARQMDNKAAASHFLKHHENLGTALVALNKQGLEHMNLYTTTVLGDLESEFRALRVLNPAPVAPISSSKRQFIQGQAFVFGAAGAGLVELIRFFF